MPAAKNALSPSKIILLWINKGSSIDLILEKCNDIMKKYQLNDSKIQAIRLYMYMCVHVLFRFDDIQKSTGLVVSMILSFLIRYNFHSLCFALSVAKIGLKVPQNTWIFADFIGDVLLQSEI